MARGAGFSASKRTERKAICICHLSTQLSALRLFSGQLYPNVELEGPEPSLATRTESLEL